MTATHHHTRNPIPPDDLSRGEEAAKSQEGVIKFFYNCRAPGERFTPFQISLMCFRDRVPITSVRRALTNLTDEGFLEKHDSLEEQQPGNYGAKNCTWSKAAPAGPKPQIEMFPGERSSQP